MEFNMSYFKNAPFAAARLIAYSCAFAFLWIGSQNWSYAEQRIKSMNAAPDVSQCLQFGSFQQDFATIYTDLDGLGSKNVYSTAIGPNGSIYAATQTGLSVLRKEEHKWRSLSTKIQDPEVKWIKKGSHYLYFGSMQETYQLSYTRDTVTKLDIPAGIIDLMIGRKSGDPHLAILKSSIYELTHKNAIKAASGATLKSAAELSTGQIILTSDKGLLHLENSKLIPISSRTDYANNTGTLLDNNVQAIAADGHGGLWTATLKGLNYYTHGAWLEISSNLGLPINEIKALAVGSHGEIWIGGDIGAARLFQGAWRYYAGRRWLPSDRVHSITDDGAGGAWIATEGGIAHIAFRDMTMEQKSAHFDSITEARHNRNGYVTDCQLTIPGDLNSFRYEASDNDGLWSALYICGECFHFAVTKEEAARTSARKSMNAILELVRLTGIPGFPARAVIRKGEAVNQSDAGPNWHKSPFDPDVLWKDDTSSDEIDGHFMAWYVYSELTADSDEKKKIAETCRAVMNHILDHKYTLVGPNGKHTRWGVWAPELLNNDPKWAAERGLNSLEILSHLKVAIHLCGDQRFKDAYQDLIVNHHYAANTINQKLLPPEHENNHSDDELAAVAYYPLLQLEEDPELRGIYLLSLQQTQNILKPERSPLYNILFGACSGLPCDAEAAVQWLRDCPLDLIKWGVVNSVRADVTLSELLDRFQHRQLTHVLNPNETQVSKWNYNPYAVDTPGNGGEESDGTFWLLPYWMGRYHKILGATK